jgi:hypothetical protein
MMRTDNVYDMYLIFQRIERNMKQVDRNINLELLDNVSE